LRDKVDRPQEGGIGHRVFEGLVVKQGAEIPKGVEIAIGIGLDMVFPPFDIRPFAVGKGDARRVKQGIQRENQKHYDKGYAEERPVSGVAKIFALHLHNRPFGKIESGRTFIYNYPPRFG
jgi:hypothetical protein